LLKYTPAFVDFTFVDLFVYLLDQLKRMLINALGT